MKWVFERAGRVRRGGSAAAYAFRPDLNVFVREVLQNAKDQKRSESARARVHFALMILREKSLSEFLDSLGWTDLSSHLEAASRQSQHAAFLKRALDRMEERRELLLMRVDDFGTGGLVGGDLEQDKPFASLCIDELFSTKESSGAGGSYGLGKSVLWRFSEFSTVLFTSRLAEGSYQKDQEGLRLFGRTQLPWHSIAKTDFDGPCWFGRPDRHEGKDTAWSVWDPESTRVARRLHLDRANEPGTSILMVGFNPPAEETLHPRELCQRICDAAARDFWPVVSGLEPELEVSASLTDIETGELMLTAKAEITAEVKPFVSCLEAFRASVTVETISSDGDVAAASIPLKIPATLSGDAAVEAEVTLCVRLAPKLKGLVNNVAYARGFGMVVQYRNLDGISLSAQPFVATLLCGTLRGTSPGDQAVERFLRIAEPPEHNTWTSNQRLQSTYRRGYGVLLEQLDKQVAVILKRLVSQAAGEGDSGPQLLSALFPIGAAGKEKRRHPFTVTNRSAVLSPGGEWLFAGQVRRSASKEMPWRVRVALRFGSDDGADVSVIGAVEKVSPPATCRISRGVAIIEVPATADRLTFSGRSDPALHPVSSKRASVRMDIGAGVAEDEVSEATAAEAGNE